MMQSYEQIVRLLESLDATEAPNQFRVEWLDSLRIAVGRDAQHHHCLFLVGDLIAPAIDAVMSAMRHGVWRTTSGEALRGNLLQLPDGEPFRAAIATIAAELFLRGVESRPLSDVFAEVEPFVALVLGRVLLPAEYVLGLVGELIVLHDLLLALGSVRRAGHDATAPWRGWQNQARDFMLGRAAIEVKTTGLSVSRHMIGSLEQVEPRTLDSGAIEELYLASVGLRPTSGSGPLSVAALTDGILSLLRSDATPTGEAGEAETKFLDRLSQYGPKGFAGYRHAEMRNLEPYAQIYTTTFAPRIYDMGDENIRIIRRADLAERFSFVSDHGLRFTVEFPDSIPGSINNPRSDLVQVLKNLVGVL